MAIAFPAIRQCGKPVLPLLLMAVLATTGGCGGQGSDSSDGGGRSKAGGSGDVYPAVEGCPRFATTSDDVVTFRYKVKAGQKVGFSLEMDMHVAGDAPSEPGTADTNMTMSGDYEVKSVDANGDFLASMVIGRATMKISQPLAVSFDSAKDGAGANRAFRWLMAMVKVPMSVKVSPNGKLLETEFQSLLEAVRRVPGETMADSAAELVDELVKAAFPQLPEKPLRAGDTYEAGETVRIAGDGGTLKANIRYNVVAVSGDKGKAILRPKGEFVLNSKLGAKEKTKLDSCSMDGWILFDLEKGKCVRSAVEIKMRMTIGEGREADRTNAIMMTRYDSSDK